jgi:sugar transferase EpsL
MRNKRIAYCTSAKRLFDLALTIPALILLFPLYGLLTLLVHFRLGPPVLFRQQRPGLHGQPFTIFKFRTMTDACDSQGNLLPDKDRLPPFGQFLRCTSLDELPELINVLKGEMSLVGPRPLLIRYLDRYSPEQMRRHEVKPGITGWAQVNGRNALTWERKFELDVWYVDHQSLWLDLKIITLTGKKIIIREGITFEGYATGDSRYEFLGTAKHERDRERQYSV